MIIHYWLFSVYARTVHCMQGLKNVKPLAWALLPGAPGSLELAIFIGKDRSLPYVLTW